MDKEGGTREVWKVHLPNVHRYSGGGNGSIPLMKKKSRGFAPWGTYLVLRTLQPDTPSKVAVLQFAASISYPTHWHRGMHPPCSPRIPTHLRMEDILRHVLASPTFGSGTES